VQKQPREGLFGLFGLTLLAFWPWKRLLLEATLLFCFLDGKIGLFLKYFEVILGLGRILLRPKEHVLLV